MLARPKKILLTILFIYPYILSNPVIADPIGSPKSIKKFQNLFTPEAPIKNSDHKKIEPTVTKIAGSNDKIARSQFTTAVVNREPTDNVIMLTNNSNEIYYFSELSNFKGHNVTHRWRYQGKLMAEVKFDVKSDRWRVFSSKKIRPDWTGEWLVELVDESGQSLQTSKLQVVTANDN